MKTATGTNVSMRTYPPPGTYQGRWGGYRVTFLVGGKEYQCDTDIGIRTPNAPCTVVVTQENIEIHTDK